MLGVEFSRDKRSQGFYQLALRCVAHLSKSKPDPIESALVLPLKVESPDLNGYCMLVGNVVRVKSDSVASGKDENDVDFQNSFQQAQEAS